MNYHALAGGLALGLLLGRLNAQTPQAARPESIPAAAFFQPADFTSPALSPDGRNIAFIGRKEGHASLFLIERASGGIRPLFRAEIGQVDAFWWKGDRRLLLAGHSAHGRAYFIEDLDSGKARELWTLRGVPVRCINPLPRDVGHVVVAPTAFGTSVTEIDLLNDRLGRVEHLEGDENHCVTSIDGELRACTHSFADSWRISWRSSARASWHELKGEGDVVPFRPVAMDADDRHLLVFAYDQGDTVALMRLDPDSDQRTPVVQYKDRDVLDLYSYPAHQCASLAASYRPGEDDVQVLDETAGPFYATLSGLLPGACNRWVNSSADGSLRIVFSWSGRDPGRFYLYDDNRKTLSPLGRSHPDLPPAAMGEVRYFTYQTRDAVSECGYVVLPPKVQGGPPPLLVLPMSHVGESADTGLAFNGLAQFFASRGFAVARFAIRGTYGFGRAFETAGDFQFGGRLVQDIEDGVNHLDRAGLADGRRVGIIGWHMGGLIALRTAAASPLFRAVAVVDCWADLNVNDLFLLTSSTGPMDRIIEQLGGRRNAGKIASQLDPETFLQSLSAPTLIAYHTWYGHTEGSAGNHVRGIFKRFKKPFEWFDLDTHLAKLPEAENDLDLYDIQYQVELYTRIADFFNRTL